MSNPQLVAMHLHAKENRTNHVAWITPFWAALSCLIQFLSLKHRNGRHKLSPKQRVGDFPIKLFAHLICGEKPVRHNFFGIIRKEMRNRLPLGHHKKQGKDNDQTNFAQHD